MAQIWWLILAISLAILLDVYVIRAWQRYRRIRQEHWSYREKIRAWFGLPIERKSGSVFKNAINRGLEKLNLILQWKISKILVFFSSIGFIVFGQYLITRFVPIEALSLISQRINQRFRIDLNNLDNIIVGMPLILLGGALFAFSTRAFIFRGNESAPSRPGKTIIPWKNSQWRISALVGSAALIFLLIRLLLVQAHTVDTIAWIIGIGGFLIAAFWLDKAAQISLKVNLSPSEFIQLLLIFALGLMIGVYQLQDIPNSLMGDEGNFLETARAIAMGSYTPSPFDLGVYSYPILSSLWQAWILKFFGISLWSWRFSSVLPAVLTVFPLYLLSRDLFGRGVGLASSLALIFSPYFLAFSRLGYNNSQSILVVALCVWLIYTGTRKGSFLYSFLGGAAAGLGFLTYTAGRLGLVIVCLYLLSLFLAKSSKTKRKTYLIKILIPFAIGWFVLAAPNTVYNLKNAPESSRSKMVEGLFFHVGYGRDFYMEDELFAYAPLLKVDQHEYFYNPQIYPELIVRGVVRSLLAFHHEDLISEHFISDSLSGPYATIYFIFGASLVFAGLRDRNFLLIAIWFASGLFFLSMISTYPPRHQHLVPVIPAMAIMIGLGVIASCRQIASFLTASQETRRWLQFPLAALIIILLGFVGLREYFIVMPNMYRPHLEQVINWFGLHNASDIDYVYIHDEPIDEEWRPYLFRELLLEHQFSLLSSDQFLRGAYDFSTDPGIAVFYGQEQAAKITLELIDTIPDAQAIAFLDRDQEIAGRAVIQGDITVPSPASFPNGLLGVFRSPVMWLLSPLLLFTGYYWVTYRQDISIFPQQAGTSDDASLQEISTADPGMGLPEAKEKRFLKIEKGPGLLEISCCIRLKVGDQIHSFQPKLSIHFDKEKVSSE